MATTPAAEASAVVTPALVEWDCDTLLKDGSVVRIRPIRPTDADGWRLFFSQLSERTIYLRFFGPHLHPSDAEIEHFVSVDYVDRMAFVVEQHGAIIGIGRYDRVGPTSAEIAFAVNDSDQGRGVGTLLLEYLVGYARAQGVHRFVADTLAHNVQMVNVFRGAGFQVKTSTTSGVTRVVLELAPTTAVLDRVELLEWQADVASMRSILEPRSIAVVGAGRSGMNVGSRLLANLMGGGYQGSLAAINPNAEPHSAEGVTWSRTVADSPFPVDLAIVAVPPAAVLAVVDACAAAAVRGLVIVTSGFAEAGADGVHLQGEIVSRAHRAGMRIVGPNCLGIINTDAAVSMNATFAAGMMHSGHVALASQSGAVGIALLEQTQKLDLGVSSFVSMGNKADISGNDLLRYWHQDTTTRTILLYLESLGNMGRFFEIARTVSRTKPIVVLKSGRSVAGARAAASHTASLASPDRAADALFAQAGVIRAATLEEMLAVGSLLDHAPVPRGGRIAIITNAGGAAVLAADAADESHLEVLPLPADIQDQLREAAPGAAAVENPVDLGAGCDSDIYARALDVLAHCRDLDAIVAIHAVIPQLATTDFVSLAVDVAGRVGIPVVAVTLGVDVQGHAAVARFAFPEAAVRALARVVAYGRWREADPGSVPALANVDRPGAHALVQRVLADNPDGRWLDPDDSALLLHAYGIPLIGTRRVRTAEPAIAAAQELGFPVALKADVPGLLHKLDAGAVVLGVASAVEVRATMRGFRERFGSTLRSVVVQRMSPAGVELIVGAVRDSTFGALILYGSGGTNAELFGDQVTRLAPLTDMQAAQLVRAPRGTRLLEGFRGQPPCDIMAVTDVLHRVSQLAYQIPEVAEVDCNPLIASPGGATVVDARVRLAPVPPRAPSWVRTIRSGRPA